MGIIIALLIFGLIVTVHEFGHFICAKLSGVKVLEFAVGMGPKLFSVQKGETKYSLRLLPLGGYCAMEGEDEETNDVRSFRRQNVWIRIMVLFAGAFMNFVLGFILVAIMTGMEPSVPTMQIKGFSGEKKADGEIVYYADSYKCGLRHNDVFTEIDGVHIMSTTDLSYMIFQSSKTKHDITVMRDGKKVELHDVQFHDSYTGETLDFALEYEKKNPLNVAAYSAKDCVAIGKLVWMSLHDLVTGKSGTETVSGPVGVVSTIDETAKQGETMRDKVLSLLYISALLTINLGIFNLLPIPGLDGGRLLFCFIEVIRRKPVKPEHEGYVHLAGMALLFLIMIFATYNDIKRLIFGG